MMTFKEKLFLFIFIVSCLVPQFGFCNSVHYNADELPQDSQPAWTRYAFEHYTIVSEFANAGTLHLDVKDFTGEAHCESCHYYYPDGYPTRYALKPDANYWGLSYEILENNLSNSSGTIVQARLKSSGVGTAIELSDGSYKETLLIHVDYITLFNIDLDIPEPTYWMNTQSDYHVYSLVMKDGAVEVYVDCSPVMSATSLITTSERSIRFGIHSHSGPEDWDYVKYSYGSSFDINDVLNGCNPNQAPVAHAGPDQAQMPGTSIILDGSASFDPDGDPITYRWTLIRPDGTDGTAELSDAASVTPSFSLTMRGTYTATLVVNDGQDDSAADTVLISTINTAPVAYAGQDQAQYLGRNMPLDGGGSFDPDGDPITYRWTLTRPDGTDGTAELSDATSVTPSFILKIPGTYRAALVVNDGQDDSAADTVLISTVNAVPVAHAGQDQVSNFGSTVTLDGSASYDPDWDFIPEVPLGFNWTLQRPDGTDGTAELSDAASVTPSFSLTMHGTYTATLVVNDGQDDSAADAVLISTINTVPVAHAGSDQAQMLGTNITLDGSGSFDPDGDPITYRWTLTRPDGTDGTAELSGAASVTPSFSLTMPGTYTAALVVNDGQADSAADTVLISTVNAVPVAHAGQDQVAKYKSTVTLDGSASYDPDWDFIPEVPLGFSWTLQRPDGTDGTSDLSSTTAVNPSFILNQRGIYIATLTVNDGITDSIPDEVHITSVTGRVMKSGACSDFKDAFDDDGLPCRGRRFMMTAGRVVPQRY